MNFEINRALEEIFNVVSILNKFMDDSEPWNVIKKNKENAANIMSQMVECFRVLGILLQPFIPTSAKNLLDTLNINDDLRTFKYLNSKYAIKKGHTINEPKALFPRFE
jgi:methionyl-tRNA synthetase